MASSLKSDDQTQKLEEFMSHLQQERLKIEAFKRELPLCMHLLTNAMEESKKQLQSCKLDSQAPTAKPPVVLEQFIPINNMIISWSEKEKEKEKVDKSHWMTSVQLWNPTSATCNNGDSAATAFGANNEQKGTPELGVINQEISAGVRRDQSSNSCSRMMMMINQQQHTNRKTRRCWSPDLHRRFLNALDMLGGSEVATPKQIRELMKVDGLTNDEVKSHLQKYRLHTRRPGPPSSMAGDGGGGPTQVVVLGGIWVPPEYAAPPMIYGPHPTQQLMHPFHVYKASSSSQYGGSLHYSDIKTAKLNSTGHGEVG